MFGGFLHRQPVTGNPVAVATMIIALLPAVVLAQSVVPGPWGNLKDHIKPLEITTDHQRITLYRRQQMLAKSAHFRAIEAVVIYDAPFKGQLRGQAQALLGLAGTLDTLFVPGTETQIGQHGAKLEIWQQPEEFGQHVAGFRKAVDDLAAAIESGGDLNAAYIGVRHQCLACHQSYRIFKPQPKPRPL
ncbi:MAG: cytochrome c [Betaproteobacteria bacterium]|nr:cytochrome c [Betaproteobacteria bacterium]